MKKFFAVCIVLAMSMTAAAQTVDVTVSLSLPITPSGAALDQMVCSVGVQTVIEGWRMGAQADMTLMPFSPKQVLLTSQGTLGDFTIYDQSVIDFVNPIQEQVTVSTKYAGLDWRLTVAYSYTFLPEFAFTFGSATLGVSTQTPEGVKLASATTMTLQGFSKQAFTMGFSVQGVSIARTTVLTMAGLSQEIWAISLSVQEWAIARTTVYTAEGFASDTLSISKQFGDYLFVGTSVFSKAGWSKTLTVSQAFRGLSLGRAP
ncbi:MAG: hypothetical protein K6T71_07820 [Candidatus Bipolaricaulota bacterium]|nr:hypothetical protein [Candidatus Bipolaricaulota bacterium]